MEERSNGQWHLLLRAARRRLALKQQAVADVAGISVHTLRKYESGHRHPSRQHLVSILDAMRLERGERNDVLQAAGFAADGRTLGPGGATYYYTAEGAAAHIDSVPWPAFVTSEYMELIAANAMMTRLWEIDLDNEFTGPGERSLITAATNPRFSDRCVSWEQTVGAMASRFKSHHRGPEDPSAPGPYFAHIVEVLASYDPAYLTRVTGLWSAVEPAEPAVRWTYPVVWRHPDVGDMRFTGVVNCASETDGLAFNDWIPVDAATWTALERLRSIPFTPPSSAAASAAGD